MIEIFLIAAFCIVLVICLLEQTNADEARKELSQLREELVSMRLGEYKVHPKTKTRTFVIKGLER